MLLKDQGVDLNRYQVIPRTLIFVFDTKSRVLLIKGSQAKSLWSGMLNGIGGHIEQGEDIYQAAKRELLEETGLTDISLCFCGQIMADVRENTGVCLFIFRGDFQTGSLVSSSEGELFWVDLDQLGEFLLVKDLPVLIPRVMAYQPFDPLIIGKYIRRADGNLEILLR